VYRPTVIVNEPFLDMDCEKLIAAVKEKQILYVSSTKSYKNAELKAKAWEEVANELGTSGKDVIACVVRIIFYRSIPWKFCDYITHISVSFSFYCNWY